MSDTLYFDIDNDLGDVLEVKKDAFKLAMANLKACLKALGDAPFKFISVDLTPHNNSAGWATLVVDRYPDESGQWLPGIECEVNGQVYYIGGGEIKSALKYTNEEVAPPPVKKTYHIPAIVPRTMSVAGVITVEADSPEQAQQKAAAWKDVDFTFDDQYISVGDTDPTTSGALIFPPTLDKAEAEGQVGGLLSHHPDKLSFREQLTTPPQIFTTWPE